MASDPRFAQLSDPVVRIPPSLRWSGEGLELPEGTFTPGERADLELLYAQLEGVYRTWLHARPNPDWEELASGIRAFGEPPLAPALERIGASALRNAEAPPLVRRALHDLRGGAFFALRMYGSLLQNEDSDAELLEPAILLARDQAKVVRSLVPSIDREGHDRDRSEQAHGMRELVDKWDGFVFPEVPRPEGGMGPVQVSVETTWRGDLAARCLEAAALDRAVYNLVNNAARFSADGRVTLRVEALGGQVVRFAVANAMTPLQGEFLRARVGEDPSSLFLGGVTRGGEGVGLSASASVVARAWGLADAEDAVAMGSVGAQVGEEVFLAWILWPTLHGVSGSSGAGS